MKRSTLILWRSIIGAILIIAASFGISTFLAKQAEPPVKKNNRALKGVFVQKSTPENTAFKLPVYGKIKAFERIELFAEVSGILQPTTTPFLEGTSFQAGQILLHIENSEAQAALMSQKSNYVNALTQVLPDLKLDYPNLFDAWYTYLSSLDLNQSTPEPPMVNNAQAKIFLTSKGVYSAYHNLKSSEERFKKYSIKAPFKGVVTQSLIRPGTLVRMGQPLGTFINPDVFELEVSISVGYLALLEEGNKVVLHSPDIDGEWIGTVRRINRGIDPNSQTVKAYIQVKGSDLREGMYLNGELKGMELENVVSINRRLIFDNNHIWTVQDSALQKHAIDIVEYSDDNALVRGLDSNILIVTEPVLGGYTGMPVTYSEKL